ncbi:Glu-tRNA(Gln) amidotransferase subunit GatD [archaeon]|nr:Glu-tRNA(Gln) amidotransferase subunit GatD [archaeon]
MLKKEFNFGDLLEVNTDGKTLEGKYMPNSNDRTLFLKLINGYNVGIKRSKIKKIKKLKKIVKKKVKKSKIKINKKLPRVVILHTGGTVASKVSYETGAVFASYEPEEIVGMFPELNKLANIDSKLISNMWSHDIRFGHYNLMAKEIEKQIKKGARGIMITQGTDTLHYTAAALSFMLDGLPIPVIMVAAQRSSDRGSSDSFLNLYLATKFIVESDFKGVGICMHETMGDESCLILPAVKTRKFHSSRRDAFKVVNDEPIARVSKKEVKFIKYERDREKKPFIIRSFKENIKVGILKIHPHMYAEEFKNYENFDGLVIEGTGLGHTPLDVLDDITKEHEEIKKVLGELCNKIPVVMTTQTIFGRVNMNVYSKGIDLKNLGVLGDYNDTLTEIMFIKLAWLLSNFDKKDVSKFVTENFKGEINKRDLAEDDFLK